MQNALRFPNENACRAFIETHQIRAIPIDQNTHFIAIILDTRGVFAVQSETSMVLLPDW